MNKFAKYSITLLILTFTISVVAMPPHPEWVREADDEALSAVSAIHQAALARGLNSPGQSVLKQLERIPRDDDDPITLNVAVILVDFDDNEADQDAYPIEHYEEMLFSVDEYETGSMRDYYLENSRGGVSIEGEVVGWYRMPEDYSYYCDGRYGLGNYPRNAQSMTAHALQAADDDLDYRNFDNDGDEYVDAVFIVHAGPGAEEDPDNRDLIWSHAWNVRGIGTLDGVRFRKYSTVPDNGRIGVYGHELGHALFGLPDLYDTNYESSGIGNWSMMAYGAWGDDARRPVHFDPWCKLQLEWATPLELEFDAEFTLLPVETTGRVIIMWDPDDRGSEYFLVENRTRWGFDGEIPGEGILVYHIDEAMRNNDNPWWPNHQGRYHNLVAIEQADGEWHLERNENDGDEGDPYPGSEDNRELSAETEPGSRDYDGEETGASILNIEPGENGTFARWVVGADPPEVEQVIEFHTGWNLISFRLIPESDDFTEIFAPLVEAEILIIIKDERGDFWLPAWDFNGLGAFRADEGYQVVVSRDAELRVRGITFDPQFPIQLSEGWQILPFFPYYFLDVRVALAGLGEHLEIIKDVEGRFYWRRYNYSNMDDLRPGQGYFIKVNADVELVYPLEDE